MVKIIGVLLIIASGGLIGFSSAVRLSNRVAFLEEFSSLLTHMETQLHYSLESISEIFSNFNNYSKLSFIKNFIERLDNDATVSDVWCESVDTISKTYGLTKSDKHLIKSFGQNLGIIDYEGQLSSCQNMLESIKTATTEAKECKKKKFKLYLMLGLSGGICTAMMLI